MGLPETGSIDKVLPISLSARYLLPVVRDSASVNRLLNNSAALTSYMLYAPLSDNLIESIKFWLV